MIVNAKLVTEDLSKQSILKLSIRRKCFNTVKLTWAWRGSSKGCGVTATQTALSRALPCLKASYAASSRGPTRNLLHNFIPLTVTKCILVFLLS